MGGGGIAAPVINAPTAKWGIKDIPFGRKKALLCVLGIPSAELVLPSQSIWFWTSKSCAMRRLHQHIPQTLKMCLWGYFLLILLRFALFPANYI